MIRCKSAIRLYGLPDVKGALFMPREGPGGSTVHKPRQAATRSPTPYLYPPPHSSGGAGSGKSALMEIRLFLETPEDAEEGEQRGMSSRGVVGLREGRGTQCSWPGPSADSLTPHTQAFAACDSGPVHDAVNRSWPSSVPQPTAPPAGFRPAAASSPPPAGQPEPPGGTGEILLFFKEYDPVKETLTYRGHHMLGPSCKVRHMYGAHGAGPRTPCARCGAGPSIGGAPSQKGSAGT